MKRDKRFITHHASRITQVSQEVGVGDHVGDVHEAVEEVVVAVEAAGGRLRREEGIVLNEPSVVAIRNNNNQKNV